MGSADWSLHLLSLLNPFLKYTDRVPPCTGNSPVEDGTSERCKFNCVRNCILYSSSTQSTFAYTATVCDGYGLLYLQTSVRCVSAQSSTNYICSVSRQHAGTAGEQYSVDPAFGIADRPVLRAETEPASVDTVCRRAHPAESTS